jgi:hypothetical protein
MIKDIDLFSKLFLVWIVFGLIVYFMQFDYLIKSILGKVF